MEATGVYWKPVWHILSDGEFELVLANAGHVKNVPGRKTDVSAPKVQDLFEQIYDRYRFRLEELKPQLEVPIVIQ
jgi:hypothetical protein